MKSKVAVKIEFSYSDVITQKDYDKVSAKVMKYASDFEATVSTFYADAFTLIFVITYDFEEYGGVYSELAPRLNRMIDSHSRPATYQWASSSVVASSMAIA